MDQRLGSLKLISELVARAMMDFMYSDWMRQGENQKLIANAAKIVGMFPAHGQTDLHAIGVCLLKYFHQKHMYALFQKQPAGLVDSICAHLNHNLQKESGSLFSDLTPEMKQYLEGFMDPVLFPYNLPFLLSEVSGSAHHHMITILILI